MKTKEIDVFIPKIDLQNHCFIRSYLSIKEYLSDGFDFKSTALKAKLIIEMPEQKVEISESQLDDLAEGLRSQYLDCRGCDHFVHMGNCEGCNNATAKSTVYYKIKKKELGFINE